jgi:Dynein heavy chain AAA lid domain
VQIPYDVLNFLASYINYGGRVTDDKDLRTIDVILKDYFNPKVMGDGYKFSPSGTYYSLKANPDTPHKSYMTYIESLPINPDPEVFGMHANANITSDQNEAYDTFEIILALQPRSAAGVGKSRDEVIAETAKSIFDRLPDDFDVEGIQMVRWQQQQCFGMPARPPRLTVCCCVDVGLPCEIRGVHEHRARARVPALQQVAGGDEAFVEGAREGAQGSRCHERRAGGDGGCALQLPSASDGACASDHA